MLDCFEHLKEESFDSVSFLPTSDEGDIQIEINSLVDPGEKYSVNDLGEWHHIILFKEDAQRYVKDFDNFEAILIDPLEYISMLIPQGWYGLVCRKTTTSTKFIDDVVDKMFEE